MSVEHIETLIIGAGQAGLSTAYHLRRNARDCLIVDGNDRVGDGWRRQWDTLKLYSPARYDGLPGLPFPAPPWSFPGKDEVGDYLESYAKHFDLPVRLGTRVDRLAAHGDGYVATVGDDSIFADNVVVATGTFGRTPYVPEFADELDPMIMQLHSSEYRRPAQMREGAVLVVGASHSGADVAYEIAAEQPTILCGRDRGQIPVRLESPMFKVFFPMLVFVFKHVMTRRTPMGRHMMEEVRFHGAPALRVKDSDLVARGVERLHERVVGVQDGLPVLEGGRVADVSNVVWCTGFRQAFGWIDLPILGEGGWPVEMRGIVDAAPGLYFCGLGFQYAASSMLIAGANRDAGFIANHIVERRSAPSRATVRSV
ncbi:flavin-containing monooxygenase [Aeromicrobium sp.]|uniref:flavin-containing monooxygenase n=1 Tax=Aeromicrobium sp. TaxID=1871063 RepID=UPI003D6BC5B8